jgi:hypothetical protein
LITVCRRVIRSGSRKIRCSARSPADQPGERDIGMAEVGELLGTA